MKRQVTNAESKNEKARDMQSLGTFKSTGGEEDAWVRSNKGILSTS